MQHVSDVALSAKTRAREEWNEKVSLSASPKDTFFPNYSLLFSSLTVTTYYFLKEAIDITKMDDGIRVTSVGRGSEKKIDFLQDDPSEMTYARRIALSMMNRYKWYNPKLGTGGDGCYSQTWIQEVASIPEHGFKSTKEESSETGEGQTKNKDDDGQEERRSNNKNDAQIDGTFRSREIGHPVAVTPKDNDANLDEAWAHFEHVTLSRYVVHNEFETKKGFVARVFEKFTHCCRKEQPLDNAEPGENKFPTRMYHPLWTPHSQLGDFSLGCGIYFFTLRAFCILTFLAGCINIPSMMYYSSEAYGASRGNITRLDLRASAVCVDYTWVLCTDCYVSPSFPEDRVRFINETNPTTGAFDVPILRFARKNGCDAATIENGMINFGTLIIVALGILVITYRMSKAEVEFDVDEQTAQDYSIVIENPPSDAFSPEEWKDFFECNFEDDVHVTCCTIGVANDLLVRELINRREIMKQLEMMVDPGTSLDMLTLAGISAKIQQDRGMIANLLKRVSPGIPELYAQMAKLNAEIKGLMQLTYPVTNVFVTFETEKAQRGVLRALSVGKFQALRNNTKAIQNNSHLFRKRHVLSVAEPDEPDTIRWRYLNANHFSQLKVQFLTGVATLVAIVAMLFITREVNNNNSKSRAVLLISVTNFLFPIFGTFLVNLEEHPSESDRQASLYWKIVFFRWMNSALVFTLIIPFNETLNDGDSVILMVANLFVVEMALSTVLQLLDIVGNFKRHVSAPRAKTQDAMDLCMSAGTFDLAERYTNMSKLLFLALWYSSLYPAGFFMCSLALFIFYYIDRFNLMRSCQKPKKIGSEISAMNKKLFFPLCVFGMAFASSYDWSAFPFDNLCLMGTVGDYLDTNNEYANLVGRYVNTTITDIPPHNLKHVLSLGLSPRANITVEINSDTEVYEHCLQDFLRTTGRQSFPFVSSNQQDHNIWMTPEQELVTDIYGWTTLGILIIIGLAFVYLIGEHIRTYFKGKHEVRGEDQGIDFSNVESISTYIPQVSSTVYPFPLIASSVENIDTELFDWNDDDRPHSFYDITLDAKALTTGLDDRYNENVFCRVAHWPPNKLATPKTETASPKTQGENEDTC